MSTSGIGRQNPAFLKTGKAKLFGCPYGQEDQGIDDIGNAETVTISVDTSTTDVDTGEDNLSTPIKSTVQITGAKISITARNHNPINTALGLQAEREQYVQAQAANLTKVVNTALTQDNLDRDYGNVFRLDGMQSVTITTFKGGAAGDGPAFVQDTHYKLDVDGGFVKIIAFPVGFDGTDGFKITYSADQMSVDQYGGFSVAGGLLYTIYARETGDGPCGYYRFHQVLISPDGDQGIVADNTDPTTKVYTCAMQTDVTQPENYGLFTYRKFKGSL